MTWVTLNATDNSTLEYGLGDSLSAQISAQTQEFVDGGSEKRRLFIHTARITNLKPSERYGKLGL